MVFYFIIRVGFSQTYVQGDLLNIILLQCSLKIQLENTLTKLHKNVLDSGSYDLRKVSLGQKTLTYNTKNLQAQDYEIPSQLLTHRESSKMLLLF